MAAEKESGLAECFDFDVPEELLAEEIEAEDFMWLEDEKRKKRKGTQVIYEKPQPQQEAKKGVYSLEAREEIRYRAGSPGRAIIPDVRQDADNGYFGFDFGVLKADKEGKTAKARFSKNPDMNITPDAGSGRSGKQQHLSPHNGHHVGMNYDSNAGHSGNPHAYDHACSSCNPSYAGKTLEKQAFVPQPRLKL